MIHFSAALLLPLCTALELGGVPTCQPPGVLSEEVCATAVALVPGLLPAEVNARTGNDHPPELLLLPRGFAFDYHFLVSRGNRTANLKVRCTFSEGTLVEAQDLPGTRVEVQLVSQAQASRIAVGLTYADVLSILCAPGWVEPLRDGGFTAVYQVAMPSPQGMLYPTLRIDIDSAGIVVRVATIARFPDGA